MVRNLTQSRSALGLILGVAVIATVGATSTAHASTSSSWGGQPSWAAQEPTPPSSSRKREKNHYSSEVTPFSPGSNNISLDLGQVFLMGDLADKYDSNIGTQLHYTYGVSDLFGFDASVGYSEHSDGKLSMISGLMGVRTNLAWYDKVVPYGVFGMGFYRPSYTLGANGTGAISTTSSTSISSLLFGVHLGPGVDLALTKQIFFGAALTFHDIFGNKQVVNGQAFNVGGTFTTFLIRAGVTF